MRKNVMWVSLILTFALVEATWLELIRLQGVLPDLILVLVIHHTVLDGQQRGMVTGFIGGLLQDVATDTGLGHHALSLVVVAYVVGRVSQRLITDHPAVKAGLVFCAAILHGLIYTLVDYLQHPELNAVYTIGVVVVPAAFYTALVAPVIFVLLGRSGPRESPAPGGAH